MEPGGSMPHSQGLFINSYPEPNQPIGLTVNILQALLSSSILAIAHLNLLDLITLSILGERYKL